MFWWSIIASACRSASKRAMTCSLSMPGLMILSATLRRTGCVLLGHVNDAHAPFADLLEQMVGTDPRPHSLGQQPLARDRTRGGERLRQKTSELPDVRDSPAYRLRRDERLRQKTSELLLLGKQTL